MNKYIKIIVVFIIITIIGCNKNESSANQEIGEPQMLRYIDSMLAEVGLHSYNDVLTGKLEGNFEFFSYTAPYEANCTNYIPQTQLNGSVGTDSTHTTQINAGNLYVNDLMIPANPTNNFRYVINIGDADYISKQTEVNKMYGKINYIKLIKDGITVFDKSLYIPKYVYLQGYDCTSLKMQGDPIMEGISTIKWNADYNNKNGVIIQFEGKDINNVEKKSLKLVSDIGKYTITNNDINIYSKENNKFLGIKITITRGNFFLTNGTDGLKYNFTLTSNCDYYYELP